MQSFLDIANVFKKMNKVRAGESGNEEGHGKAMDDLHGTEADHRFGAGICKSLLMCWGHI
jgi:hypothetical protein